MAGLKRMLANQLGKGLGAHIVREYETNDFIEKRFIGLLFDKLNVDCVLDVGANAGQYGHLLREAGYTGLIVSFEPNPPVFEELRQASDADGKWVAFPQALGAAEGELPFNVMVSSDFSSFRKPSSQEERLFARDNQIARTVSVKVSRLDAMLQGLQERFGFTSPLLKMDTQGFDLEVLEGAAGVLDAIVGLSSEISVHRMYEDSPTMLESLAAIGRAGFDPVYFLPVHPGRIVNPIEFNCYAVRRDLAV